MTDQEFWEWCGFKRMPRGNKGFHFEGTIKTMNWIPPDELDTEYGITHLPRIDLSNLFDYAVPLLKKKVGYKEAYKLLLIWIAEVMDGKDPAQVLYQAIKKVGIARQTKGENYYRASRGLI